MSHIGRSKEGVRCHLPSPHCVPLRLPPLNPRTFTGSREPPFVIVENLGFQNCKVTNLSGHPLQQPQMQEVRLEVTCDYYFM